MFLQMNGGRLFDAKAFEEDVGGPIFTRAVIKLAAGDIELARNPEAFNLVLRIPNAFGDNLRAIDNGNGATFARLTFTNTFNLMWHGDETPLYTIERRSRSDYDDNVLEHTAQTTTVKPGDDRQRQYIASMPAPLGMSQMDDFRAQLVRSQSWTKFRSLLQGLNVEVNNIVCIAMGSFIDTFNDTSLNRRTATQHLFACATSLFLRHQYRPTTSSCPWPSIVAYDPAYTLSDAIVLSRLVPPIEVVSDPYHYLSITPNTLVISICCPNSVPAFEIIADLLSPGGPAAILTNDLVERSWHKDGKLHSFDTRTPRVNKMMELFEEKPLAGMMEGLVSDNEESDWIEWIAGSSWWVRKV